MKSVTKISFTLKASYTVYDENHSVEINKFYNNIMQACMKASEICIPQKGIGVSSKQIPGWSEHIEPYRQTSIFWHNLWKDNGCPATG